MNETFIFSFIREGAISFVSEKTGAVAVASTSSAADTNPVATISGGVAVVGVTTADGETSGSVRTSLLVLGSMRNLLDPALRDALEFSRGCAFGGGMTGTC